MAYDEGIAQRIREALFDQVDQADLVEKKMFGGLCFMVGGHMCCGVTDENLMARVGPDQYEDALGEAHAKEMDFTGKPLKGFVYVESDGFEADTDLEAWIDRCRKFIATLPPK